VVNDFLRIKCQSRDVLESQICDLYEPKKDEQEMRRETKRMKAPVVIGRIEIDDSRSEDTIEIYSHPVDTKAIHMRLKAGS